MAKYKAYPEYKDSGVESVDTIPKTWSIKKLKYIFEIKKRIAGKIGYDVLSVTQKGIKIKDIESGEGQLSMDYSKYQRVYLGEFAMNHMDLLTGYIDISNYDGVTSPDYRVFSVRDKNSFYSRYYLYLLQDGYKQRRFFHLGQGSAHLGRWRLPTEAFNEILYPCPSLKEQTQIASFLDNETAKIDSLIEKQQQLIELLKEKRQAVISHAVTKGLNPDVSMKDSGVEWLGEVPQNWDVVKGGYIGRLFGSESVSENSVSDFGQLPFIKVSTLSLDSFSLNQPEWFIKKPQDKNYKPESNYIVFPKRGAAIFTNKVNLVRESSIIDPNLMGWKIKEGTSAEYVAFVLKKRGLSDIADVSTVPQINNKHIAPEKFPLPPYEEQLDIVIHLQKSLSTIDDLIAITQKGIELSQERRTALISAAVTGKIDVRDWVAPATQGKELSQEVTA
nr:restriction endonuclease subunit S [Pantoea sp. 201603H]